MSHFILDHVFDYLETGDQMRAKLVCCQWNHQLASLRYRKATKLRLTPYFLANWAVKDIQQAVGQAKYHCIEVCDFFALSGRASQKCIETLVQLLEECRCALEELSLEDCSEESLRAVFGVLGQARQLRHLRVNLHRDLFRSVSLPKIPRTAAEPDVFAFVTHLEVTLGNGSCVELVSSLANQLTHLALTVYRKDLLLRCWNEIHLCALRSLTVATADAADIDFIQPGELGGACWRMLERLETLTCTDATLLYMVLAEILRHSRNLKRLVIENCNVSTQCVEQIGTLEGLKDLRLNLFRSIGNYGRTPPTLNLPNLEHLHLSTENNIRLGHAPKASESSAETSDGSGASSQRKQFPRASLTRVWQDG
uniref:Uncharacterized protein n=1 Tax=Anopheles atroparvus TaxID=41427 RepID=A0A182JD24_ANOAO